MRHAAIHALATIWIASGTMVNPVSHWMSIQPPELPVSVLFALVMLDHENSRHDHDNYSKKQY
jgi:hypothetical protein